MVRILILVEGETEEDFINQILAPHLVSKGFQSITATLMGNARNRNRRGGIRGWPSVRNDVMRHLNRDQSLYISTMVDYYALPERKGNAWPGRSKASHLDVREKAACVEMALQEDVANNSSKLNSQRFIPYVMMHEFEGLLFSDCQSFANSIGREDLAASFQVIRDQYSSPEDINDSPQTHPSKRITELVPEYQKPLYGNLAALEIGLDTFRRECPGFRRWLEQLEALGVLR